MFLHVDLTSRAKDDYIMPATKGGKTTALSHVHHDEIRAVHVRSPAHVSFSLDYPGKKNYTSARQAKCPNLHGDVNKLKWASFGLRTTWFVKPMTINMKPSY